jgi:hypothetical protein
MNTLHFYNPHTIYKRLNDVFEEDKKKVQEDFSPDNFIKPNLIGKVIEQNRKAMNKEIKKKQKKYNEDNLKKKYVNKELVESWIDAIKTSK